jgi:hypothetical protein
LFKLFYGFFHHSRGGIITLVPSLLLRDDGIQFFLFFLYLLLAHLELLLLLHAVVGYPKLDAKAQERRQGIMVNDTKLIIAESCITGYMVF